MKIAIYCRVSTSDQRCEMQLQELRSYAARHGWEIAQEYIDEGVSGVRARRPALDRLMADASMKRFDVLLTWKLDRFGRSLSQLIENIQKLDSYGIRFVAITQNIDTDQRNPTGRLMLHILAALAEFEHGLIQERVRAGIAAAQAAGKHCGRPRRIFRRDEALRLRQAGLSWRAIARELNIPVQTIRDSVSTVRKG